MYRAQLKCGPALLSTTQAGSGRNFSQPRARLLVELCINQLGILTRRERGEK